jgi:hypothetical protein
MDCILTSPLRDEGRETAHWSFIDKPLFRRYMYSSLMAAIQLTNLQQRLRPPFALSGRGGAVWGWVIYVAYEQATSRTGMNFNPAGFAPIEKLAAVPYGE